MTIAAYRSSDRSYACEFIQANYRLGIFITPNRYLLQHSGWSFVAKPHVGRPRHEFVSEYGRLWSLFRGLFLYFKFRWQERKYYENHHSR